MELESAAAFIEERHRGVLMTLKRDGRPHASNIVYAAADGMARMSVTDERAKTRNLRRDPRASLYATTDDFWQWAVVEGTADLSVVAEEPGDDACLALRAVYRDVRGEHENWQEFDEAMINERRLVITLHFEQAYGQLG